MRKLYTTASQLSAPVSITFAFTAIDQPFHNADLIQRAALFKVEALEPGKLQGNWVQNQLDNFGGREEWLAHHLVVLHKFLEKAEKVWDPSYQANHRLAHYEQCLLIMGDLLNIKTPWLIETLKETTQEMITDSDWTLQGVIDFANELRDIHGAGREFVIKDVCQWAQMEDDYSSNPLLTTPKRLGRYFVSHKGLLESTSGIVLGPTVYANRKVYMVL